MDDWITIEQFGRSKKSFRYTSKGEHFETCKHEFQVFTIKGARKSHASRRLYRISSKLFQPIRVSESQGSLTSQIVFQSRNDPKGCFQSPSHAQNHAHFKQAFLAEVLKIASSLADKNHGWRHHKTHCYHFTSTVQHLFPLGRSRTGWKFFESSKSHFDMSHFSSFPETCQLNCWVLLQKEGLYQSQKPAPDFN